MLTGAGECRVEVTEVSDALARLASAEGLRLKTSQASGSGYAGVRSRYGTRRGMMLAESGLASRLGQAGRAALAVVR